MDALGVKVVEELGRGSSGVVYKVQSNIDGKFYVVKVISLSDMSRSQQAAAQTEVEILKTVQHPHIIKYYSSLIADSRLYILMEYATGGDLQALIEAYKQQKKSFSERTVWTYAYELALGIKYLHSQSILHRDIKCMNVFIDSENRLKIGDLGLSKVTQEVQKNQVGTPLFHSPELIRRLPYSFKVDVWAMGCVLYYLAALEPPFLGNHLITLGQNIVQKTPAPLSPKYSQTLQRFIFGLLDKDQKQRPSIREVLRAFPKPLQDKYKPPRNLYSRLTETQRQETLNEETARYRLKYKKCIDMAKCVRPTSRSRFSEEAPRHRHSRSELPDTSRAGFSAKRRTIRDLAKL